MALKSRKNDEDEDGESSFMPLEEVMRKLKAGPLNFGVFQTTDKDNPVLLAAHKRRNPAVLGKQAKKEAGTTKGAFGRLSLESGELIFACENEDAPASLKKRLRVQLRAAGYSKFKARIVLPGGIELGDDEDDGEETGDGGFAAEAPAGEEDAGQEAHRALIERAGALENLVYDNDLDESHPELLSMLQKARGAAHDERFDDSTAALDEAEAAIGQAIATGGAGDKDAALKREVEARWAEFQPILESLAEAGDGRTASQAAKLLKLKEALQQSGDYRKAQGALVVIERFIENALATIGRDDGKDQAADAKPTPKAPGGPTPPAAPPPAADGISGKAKGDDSRKAAAPPPQAPPPGAGKPPAYANGAPPVTAEENARLAALPPAELAKTDLTLGDTKALFSEAYMMKLKDAPIRGEGNPRLKDLMGEIEKGLSGKRRLEVMEELARIVGIPPTAEKLDLDYGRFLVVRAQQKTKEKEKGEVPALATDIHPDFRGSRSQLMFGKVLGDAFGIHEVFAALLSPTGGLVGPGNKLAGPINALHLAPDNPVALHGTVHDAAGYLANYHNDGPGYNYRNSPIELLGTDDPLSGQVSGIAYWVKEAGPDYVEKRVDAVVVGVEKKLKTARDAVEAEIENKIKEAKQTADAGISTAKKLAAAAEKKLVQIGDAVKDAADKARKAQVEAFEATTRKIGAVADEAKSKLKAAWDYIWN